MSGLRPSARDVERLAQRETDPAHARQFDPIVWGAAGNAALLAAVAAAAAVWLPFALLARALRKR